MFVKSYSSTVSGIEAVTVTVEANVSTGIGMYLVGLPDNAVKESQERIRSAFGNSGFRMTGKRLVVNLAPADIRKEGSAYDLAIAVSILAATGQLESTMLDKYVMVGELSLDGTLKPVRGVLPVAINARSDGFAGIIVPTENVREAAVVDNLDVIGADNLQQVAGFLSGKTPIDPAPLTVTAGETDTMRRDEDFADVKGQAGVKHALEIAAAGGHNIIMIGSPGSGKTMLARRMPTVMPPLDTEESLETTKIHSVAGKLGADSGLVIRRPFRSPHHLTSQVALVGGGTNPQPGEISLAHNGVLFLDELAEFSRSVLEVLRQPLEDKKITVARARYSVDYPANFTLIASMNPCPCGYYNHPTKECTCTPGQVARYMSRISGPLLDRIDMHIEVTPVTISEIGADRPSEQSSVVRERVIAARKIQRERFAGETGIHTNSMMNSSMLNRYCRLSPSCAALLEKAMTKLDLSARAYDRIIKVARTIADMDCSPEITAAHIAEAINYRSLDREGWGR